MRIIDFFWKGNGEFHKSNYNVYFRIDLKKCIVAKYILQYILTTVTK